MRSWGGTCTNDGCVPTRALAKAARLVRDAGQFADYCLRGLAPGVGFSGALLSAQRVVEEVHTTSNASGIGWMPRKLKALRKS